ncbi:MAG: hypothetical protein IKA75_04380 [Bacteroidaceae bacterium]|nr:hypothetical protein [Bacteroidaceae bacterium]
MKIKLFLLTTLCAICASCYQEEDDMFEYKSEFNSEYNTRSFNNSEEQEKILDIIQKYNLEPVAPSEYTQIDITKLTPISSAEQLDAILSKVNIVEYDPLMKVENQKLTRVKTRGESGGGQNIVPISGSNSDGTATVYVDLNGPSVDNSTVHLGLMDAFLAYQHVSGSAYRNGNKINFTAYGEGWVKLIFEGIELYKYSTTIEGNCNSDGTNGVLTKF